MTKHNKLLLIVLFIISVSAVGSLLVNMTWFQDDDQETLSLGLVAPLSGSAAGIGKSMQQGIELLLDEINTDKFYHGRRFQLTLVDQAGGDAMAVANQALSDQSPVVGLVGRFDRPLSDAVASRYANSGVSVVAPVSMAESSVQANDWLYSTVYPEVNEARFLANYVRNVVGKKLVTIIYEESARGQGAADGIETVYQRFGTRINYKHSFATDNADQALSELALAIKDKKDLGLIFIVASATDAATAVAKLRAAGINNQMAGLSTMASSAFADSLKARLGSREDIAPLTNKILVASPMLFDIAGEQAQRFKNSYQEKYQQAPDWVAAHAYESARLIVKGLLEQPAAGELAIERARGIVADYLASLSSVDTAHQGITGEISFGASGIATPPVSIGIYDGRDIVAAPTQLQPLAKDSIVDYFDELKTGRMLYVNNRFMYKTNVVYTGIELEDIGELDLDAGTAKLDLAIWFRFRGKFDPAQIQFMNSVSPIALETPDEVFEKDGVSFQLYRISDRFKVDLHPANLRYGQHRLGVSFTHSTLNQNNLVYVADVLGMGLNQGTNLKTKLLASETLDPDFGWKLDNAWLSQGPYTTPSYGSPFYVGHGTVAPMFSRVDVGLIISEDKLNIHDFIAAEYLIYIGIFGLVGSIVARRMDKALSGYFWQVSSWGVRLVSWSLLLLAIDNLVMNLAINNGIPVHYTEQLNLGFEVIWWLLPATLVVIAVERFFWVPLENKAQRKIPKVIRLSGAFIIYLLAFLGVVAFVFNQPLTSLLATGGLFTMIIGLAIQGNLNNVFSGIIINVEKPFSIGDSIKINDIDAVKVVDMTWRTLRIKNPANNIISIPNGKVADSVIINYTADYTRVDIMLQVSPKYDPAMITALIVDALSAVEGIHNIKPAASTFRGTRPVINKWVAEYAVNFWIEDYDSQLGFKIKAWEAIWAKMHAEGISLDATDDSHDGLPAPVGRAKEVVLMNQMDAECKNA